MHSSSLIYHLYLDNGEDFNSNNLLLTFVSGAAPDTQCITIDIIDDLDFEENQSFFSVNFKYYSICSPY